MFPTTVTELSAISVLVPRTTFAVRPRVDVLEAHLALVAADGGLRQADDLVAEDVVGQPEGAVELLHRTRLGRHVEEDVEALGALGDLVGEPALAPLVDAVDSAATGLELLGAAVHDRLHLGFLEARLEDDNDFVGPHGPDTSLWTRRLALGARDGHGQGSIGTTHGRWVGPRVTTYGEGVTFKRPTGARGPTPFLPVAHQLN